MTESRIKNFLSGEQLREATLLSEEVLKNIELSELPLSSIALRAARLCRLLNLHEVRKIFEYEVSGYPTTPAGMTPEVWALANTAGRTYKAKGAKGEFKEYAYLESIDILEEQIRTSSAALGAAADPNVNLSSANPYQQLYAPIGNKHERQTLVNTITTARKRLAERKAYIYKFALDRYLQLKFSGIVSDFFSNVRSAVDEHLLNTLPDATEKLSSIIENLRSENAEDWSNAVHSCRRLLQSLADTLFPAQIAPREKAGKEIKLGVDNYINRLVCYVEDQSDSDVYFNVVGSTLEFLGDRLDAVFNASQKGSHASISDRYEAERYVVYTYMVIGDILRLKKPMAKNSAVPIPGDPIPTQVAERPQAVTDASIPDNSEPENR